MKKVLIAAIMCLCVGCAVPLMACNEPAEPPAVEVEETTRLEIKNIVIDALDEAAMLVEDDDYTLTETYENQTYTVKVDMDISFSDNAESAKSIIEENLATYEEKYEVAVTIEDPYLTVVVRVA